MNGWIEKPLGDIVTVTQGHTFSQRFQGCTQGQWDYFKVADIGDRKNIKYLFHAINRVETDVLQLIGATVFPKGSIVFPRVGAALLNNNKRILAVDGVTDDNVLVLTIIDGKRYHNEFVFYWLCLQDLATFSNEGLVPVIASKNVRTSLISLPPLEEQNTIAAALSDVDGYIAALEHLIVKKRNIKKGVMQELLTGRQRLPGFSGEWVEKKLGDIGIISGSGVDKKISANETPVTLLNYLDVYRYAYIHRDMLHHVVTAKSDKLSQCGVIKGDVFFTPTSETADDIAKTAVAVEDMGDVVYSYHVVRLRLFSGYNSIFVKYACDTTEFIGQTTRLADGSGTRYVISLPKFREQLGIRVPPTEGEQTAIATILYDIDAEIDMLTEKLKKVRNIKQGMMQELLTGRIRLITKEVEDATVAKLVTKAIELPKHEPETIVAHADSHNQQFDDAVMIAGIVNALYSDQYPLGRKRVQKCLYLLRRHQDESIEAFKKKAAGPYADEVRYKGGEPIARSAKYITTTTTQDKSTTFARGSEIEKALGYIKSWGKQVDIQWVADKLKYLKTDELELLATVDMSICDLLAAGTTVSVDSVKNLIATTREWKAKLERPIFSDANIARAIKELPTLL